MAINSELHRRAEQFNALGHELRLRMVLAMRFGSQLSPSELAQQLDEPLGNVSYHMRFLLDRNMVRLMRTEPRRGAVEHYYRLTPAASGLLGLVEVAVDEPATNGGK